MGLCRDPAGVFFCFLCHLAMFGQLMLVLYTDDEVSKKKESISNIEFITYLPFHKIVFYFFLFLTLISQLKSSFTDPGKITHDTNPRYIEYYLLLYENSMIQAQQFTKEKGSANLAKIIDAMNKEDGYISDESDYDDFEYEAVTSVPDELVAKIETKYKIRLRRCDQCYIVRPNRVHHCAICRGCILGMDHHCPWINNCVGQFNKKFFFLFNLYSFIGSTHSLFICVYYTIYKNNEYLFNAKSTIWLVILQIVLCLLFGIFSFVMLKNMYDNIENDSTYIDYRNKKVLEKRTWWEEVYEMFGGEFGIGWFLPIKTGGFKNIFNKIAVRNCVMDAQ